MKTLSKEAERQLLDATNRVCRLVDHDGLSPTDAVVKVATEKRLPPGHVPLIARAYNTGLVTAQREQGGDAAEKFAAATLADAAEALHRLYPTPETPATQKLASVVSDEYAAPPRETRLERQSRLQKLATTKQAAAAVPRKPDPDVAARRAIGQVHRCKKAVEEARRQYSVAKDSFAAALGDLGEYFKRASRDRLSLADVEGTAVLQYGEHVRPIFGYVATRNRMKEARAGTVRVIEDNVGWVQTDMANAPWDVIERCNSWQKQAHEARQALDAAQTELTKQASVGRSAPREAHDSPPPSVIDGLGDDDEGGAKTAAGLMGGLMGGAAMTGMLSNMGSKITPSTDQLVGRMLNKLTDPSHENELRAIKAKADLSDMMANDEVISGYDPDEILAAYNELSQLGPRGSIQPMVMRAMLRKRLTQGAIEPFEAGEMVNIEKGLRQTAGGRNVLDSSSVLP